MKIKLGDLQTLQVSFQELTREKLPIKIAYYLNKFIKNQFDKEYQNLHEIRIKTAEKYCLRDENEKPISDEKGMFQFSSENGQLADQEFRELLNEEIEFDFNPIDINQLSNLSISPQSLMVLEELGFVKGDEDVA